MRKLISTNLMKTITAFFVCCVTLWWSGCSHADNPGASATPAANSNSPSSQVTPDAPTAGPPSAGKEDDISSVVFLQVYGTGKNNDTPIEHGFIELYNTGNEDVSLAGYSLQYANDDGEEYKVFRFDRNAVIAAGGHYLVRCRSGALAAGLDYDSSLERVRITSFDATWDIALNNKQVKLALVKGSAAISPKTGANPVSVTTLDSVITFYGAQGKDETIDEVVSLTGISKQKAGRRASLLPGNNSYTTVSYDTATYEEVVANRPWSTAGDQNTWQPNTGYQVSFSQESGFFDGAFDLTLNAAPGYVIYYTLDGSEPTKSSSLYTGPIRIVESGNRPVGPISRNLAYRFGHRPQLPETQLIGTTVRAIAVKGSHTTPVVTKTYFALKDLAQKYNLPYINLSVEKEEFANSKGIYYATKLTDDPRPRITAFCETFESNGARVGAQYVEIAMSGNGSLGFTQRSIRLYFKSSANPSVENNPSRLNYDIFNGAVLNRKGETVTSYKQLVLRNSGNDCNRTLLRDALIHTLCKDLKVDTMASRPGLVFINGEFWGVYNIRERYGSQYISSHYGVAEENVVMLEAPSPLVTENNSYTDPFVLCDGVPGDEVPFEQLIQYAISHDLSVERYYKTVTDQVDIESLMDLYITHIFMSNADWPGNNEKVWRNKNPNDPSGIDTKWRFMLLDVDMGLGFNDSASGDLMYHAFQGNGKKTSELMLALLKNNSFRQQFIDRFLYVTDNVFSSEKTVPVLNELVRTMTPAMSMHFARWQNLWSGMNWNNEVQVVRTFLQNRPYYAKLYLLRYFGIS